MREIFIKKLNYTGRTNLQSTPITRQHEDVTIAK